MLKRFAVLFCCAVLFAIFPAFGGSVEQEDGGNVQRSRGAARHHIAGRNVRLQAGGF